MSIRKYQRTWQNTTAGFLCILAGAWELYHTKELSANAIMAFSAGWGLISSEQLK